MPALYLVAISWQEQPARDSLGRRSPPALRVIRIAISQRLDDLREVVAELERELRIERDEPSSRPKTPLPRGP
jgi:hypothetical protein